MSGQWTDQFKQTWIMHLCTQPANKRVFVPYLSRTVRLFCCLVLAVLGSHEASAQKTDVILIVADGFGWNDASIHQQTEIQTPNVDSIGREGIRADRYIVTEPGVGSFAALLTGRYSLSSRTKPNEDNGQAEPPTFDLDDPIMGRVFKKNGYRTGWFGRWPFNKNYEIGAVSLGFETISGKDVKENDHEQRQPVESEDRQVATNEIEKKNDKLIGDLEKFIASKSGRKERPPYLAVVAPFSYEMSDVFPPSVLNTLKLGNPEKADRGKIRSAVSVYETDRTVGKILEAITATNPENEPLVIFTSNGTEPNKNQTPWLESNPQGIDEGGTRVPFFVKGKWIASGKMIVPPIADIDLLPSLKVFCSLLKDDSDGDFDGLSMAALAYGLPMRWRNRPLFQFVWGSGSAGAIRTIEWRAVRSPATDTKWKLFHMLIDPSQMNDLANQKPEEVSRLSAELERAYEEILTRE